MGKMVYGKAMRTGWILMLIGIIATIAGINLAGSTNNDGFFALMALGVVLVISGIATAVVYAGMEMGVQGALKDSSPLLRYAITAQDYAAYAAQQAEEIRSANKMFLLIELVFCALLVVAGPFMVKDSGIILPITGIVLALILSFFAWSATKYRVNKLKNADKEVVLTSGSAYVGGEFHVWSVPGTFLSQVAYFGANELENSPLAAIRITYNALTRTITTPYTILIPVPASMEEKAKAAVEALKNRAKPAGNR